MSIAQNYRNIIKKRLLNRSEVFFVVVGPCSLENEEETRLYEQKLLSLQNQLGETIFLVMRSFVEKSRSSYNWRGFVYQPDKNKAENILEGIKRCKGLFSTLTMPLAMEFIDPSIYPYLAPYISWGFIGARTVTSSLHRSFVSNSDLPFGFKNSIDGDITPAINGCTVAKNPHCILTSSGQHYSKGNCFTHVVLRGGKNGINYDSQSIDQTVALSKKEMIKTPILIDCSHGNCPNKPYDQTIAFRQSVQKYLQSPHKIMGAMLESNLYEGAQKTPSLFGVSTTDPCLSFETTKELLLEAKETILQRYKEELDQPTSYVYNQ